MEQSIKLGASMEPGLRQLGIAIMLQAASAVSGGDYLDDVGHIPDDQLISYIHIFYSPFLVGIIKDE